MDVETIRKSIHDFRGCNLTMFRKYRLASKSVSNYASEHWSSMQPHFKNSIFLKPGRGRPTSFDDQSKMAIVEALSGPMNVTTVNYGKLLDSEVKLTASRSNVAQQQFQTPHRSTKFLLGRQLHVNSGVGEETTSARAVATRSIWNAVSFAAMNCAMRSLVHLIANVDASQFKVGNSLDGRVEVEYIVDSARPAALKSVADNNGIVAYFIKYFLLIFADSLAGPPVYVIADANMPADVIDGYTIPGLGISTGVMSTGFVVFCQTRCANQAFFEWLIETIIFTAI